MNENPSLAQTSRASGGASSNVMGHSNMTQTVNVEAAKSSKLATLVVPLLAALISAVGGAYATHQFSLARAPERTASQTETLLGVARGAIELAQSTRADPALLAKLQDLASQTQAVQANVELLRSPPGSASLQADFWLPMNKGALLGDAASFGVNGAWGPGDIRVQLNERSSRIQAGVRLPYKTKQGKSCYVMYVGQSPDAKLHGFKTSCEG
jgi:hypothetical protein